MEDQCFSSVDATFSLKLSAEHLNNMLAICKKARSTETGGILIGYYTETHDCAVVTKVLGPPSDSRASRATFFRGVAGLTRRLRKLWERPHHYYLGEWHFHPYTASEPSGIDHKQMLEIAWSTTYHCPEPVLIVLGGDPNGTFSLSVRVFPKTAPPVHLKAEERT